MDDPGRRSEVMAFVFSSVLNDDEEASVFSKVLSSDEAREDDV